MALQRTNHQQNHSVIDIRDEEDGNNDIYHDSLGPEEFIHRRSDASTPTRNPQWPSQQVVVQRAPIQIQQPEALTITDNMATTWRDWRQRFEWWAEATELREKSTVQQASTLMAIIGPEAIRIYNTFVLSSSDQKNLNRIMSLFEAHFTPKRNTTYERYIFNQIIQEDLEPFDEFLTRAKNQINKCEFGALRDGLLADRIVVGVRNK